MQGYADEEAWVACLVGGMQGSRRMCVYAWRERSEWVH